MNAWKIMSIVLILAIVGLSVNLYLQQATYNLGNVEIEKNAVDEFSDVLGGKFTVCNFENECIKFVRLE